MKLRKIISVLLTVVLTVGILPVSLFGIKSSAASSTYNLMFPLPKNSGYRLTSNLGGRTAPCPGASVNHKGIDLGVAAGTEVYAIADGKVIDQGYNDTRGHYIAILHESVDLISVCQHFKSSALLKKGAVVSQGALLGYVGKTGAATGNHLHYELIVASSTSRRNVNAAWDSNCTLINGSEANTAIHYIYHGQEPDTNPDHYPFPTRNIGYYGSAMTGDDVGWVQAVLYQLGYFTDPYDIDKSFGPGTKGVVQQFQRDYGLDDDGSVGPLTRAKLNERWIIKRDGEQVFNPTLSSVSYLGSHRYEFYKGNAPWTDARDYAESIGGHLMTVTSESEQDLIQSYYDNNNDAKLWLGATDAENIGTWKWVTGEPFVFDRWAEEEPNNTNGNEHYLGTTSGCFWNDWDCETPTINGLVVEFEQGATLDRTMYFNGHTYQFYKGKLSWDTAAEYARACGGYLMTVTSAQEQELISQYRNQNDSSAKLWLGATDVETDQDWKWITGEPFEYDHWAENEPNNNSGANPESYLGTTTDGYWNDFVDAPEDITGFIVELEPIEQDIVNFEGHVYVLYGINTSWHSAEAFAEANGGHLVTIANEAEENTITYFVSELTGSVWIGATDENENWHWTWVTGEAFDYDNWNDGEPNDANDGEDYVEFYTNGTWNDVPAVYGNVCGFVVEYEPGCYSCAEDDHRWDDGVNQTPDGYPENSAILYTCEICGAERHEYVVSYDVQGGTGAPEQQIKSEGFDMTLSSVQPTKEGYTFVGWTTEKDSVFVDYKSGGIYSENAPVTLYALYKPINPTVLWGDVDQNGKVNPADGSLVLDFVVHSETPTQEQSILADVNFDGIINVNDSNLILNYYTGKIEVFPIELFAQFSFTAPTKKNYHVGEDLDLTGMNIVVTNKNNNAISYSIDEAITLNGYNKNQPGSQTITAAWQSKSYTFPVTVQGHSWNAGVVTTAATCKSTGVKKFTCTVCNATKTETIAKNPSNHAGGTELRNAVDATCEEDGYTGDTYCKGCSVKLSSGTTIDAIGHDYGAWTKLNGTYHQRVCANDETHIEKAKHTWNAGVVTVEPTCEEDGVKTYTCTVCRAKKTEVIPAFEHDWGPWTKLNATHHQRVCQNNESEIETAKHTWNAGVVTVEPTCEEDGVKTYTCTVCKAKKTEVLPATDHDWGAWTKLNSTYHQRVCQNDNEHVEKVKHTWDSGVVTTAATTTAEGVKTFTCTVCGETKTEAIPKALAKIAVSAENVTTGIKLTWAQDKNATGYYVYRKTASTSYKAIRKVSSNATVTYTDTSAEPGVKYTYCVKSYRGTEKGTYTAKSITCLAAITPTLANGKTGITLSWTKAEGADGYYVIRKTGSGSYTTLKKIADPDTLTYTDTTAESGTQYTYGVRAYKSTTKGAYTAKSMTRLSAVTPTLTNTASGITVKWTKVAGATGYYVYRKEGTGSYSLVKKITSGATVSYSDTAVKDNNGTKYTYYVRAYKSTTKSAYTAKATYRVTGVAISSLTNSAAKTMTVNWAKNAKATGYEIQYATNSGFTSAKTVTVSGASTLTKAIASLTKGSTYYVRVRAYKTVSGVKYYSAWSAAKSVKITK